MSGEKGWIGVDLDGTLAYYDTWHGAEHIGEPIPIMVERVKVWLTEGKDVKVFTARVSDPDMADRCRRLIQDWTERHIGVRLPVVCSKDYYMVELWDDRAIQVISNTGQRADEAAHD